MTIATTAKLDLRLDLTLVANTDQGSKLALTLTNLSDAPLENWQLEFSFARKIDELAVLNGALVQTGSYCHLTPDTDYSTLAPNQLFYSEFTVNLPHLTLIGYGINSAVVKVENALYPVQLTPLNLGPEVPCRRLQSDSNGRDTTAISIIPQPATLQPLQGQFALDKHCIIENDAACKQAACWLEEEIEQLTGIALDFGVADNTGGIHYRLNDQLSAGEYQLLVEPQAIWIIAGDAAGAYSATASLLQLIPSDANLGGAFLLPCIDIQDKPRFGYRGMMLDCARHFHSVDKIKQIINQLARLKFNTFHWHLTDDEAWRLEIKRYPALTEIGAWRGPEEVLPAQYSHFEQRYGGYYSQQDVKAIIAYAANRNIVVIPEIDIPGHCRAAIQSLPDMLIDINDHSRYLSIQNYRDNVLSPALSGTYDFIEGVLDEVCDLFPSQWIHIGADEVPEGVWTDSAACHALMQQHRYQSPKELQGHLLRHAERYLRQKGRRMGGWEEVVHGDKVSKETVVYSWINEQAGLACIEQGYDVIMQPGQHLYLDIVQSAAADEPGTDWAGQLPLKQVYHYDPLANAAPEHQHKILGIQAALWSETVSTPERLDYMLFPRLFAAAEVAWSETRDWSQFKRKLPKHLTYLDTLGIQYRPAYNNN